jgi:DnaB-like helicase N terminal domain/AAA domain
MKNNKKESFQKGKRFEIIFPKLENGNTDWESVHNRLNQNMDATEMLLGQLPPQAIEIEQVVLGACLIDSCAFKKAKEGLGGFTNPFYTDAHNVIWSAMERLDAKNETIDRLMVFQELQKMQKTEAIGGTPFFLVELTTLVSSAAHVESHSRIILEKHLRRRFMHLSVQLYQNASNSSTDLFKVVEEHNWVIQNLTQFNTTLKGYSFPHVMEMAKNATAKNMLVGSLIRVEDVAILFSGPENGKSVWSVQMADKISRGESLFQGLLRNECAPQKVLYFDFELTLSDYKSRYLDGAGKEYPFRGDGWMTRVGNDENEPKTFAEIANNMEQILKKNIELFQPSVVFVDNITAMSNGSTADADVVRKIMDLLLLLKKKYKLTVIVLAHTPKRYDMSKPLTIADLAGSSLLAAYADSIIVIGQSKMGNNVKYIKHIKGRGGAKIHDEQNVIQVSIEKEGAFLQMKTLEEPTGRESDHLVNKYDASVDDDLIKQIVILHDSGKSYQMIKEELNLNISRQHVWRIIKTYKEKQLKDTKDFDLALGIVEKSSSEKTTF